MVQLSATDGPDIFSRVGIKPYSYRKTVTFWRYAGDCLYNLWKEITCMPEIAYTTFGRNALLTGLISHVAAILVAMMSASGAELFFSIVFPFSCLVLVIGAYAELKNRGYYPLRDWRFYVIAAVSVFPLLGPLIVLGLLYSFQKSGQEARVRVSGLFSAIFRLKANTLVLFVLIIVLFLLFAVIHSRHDPYFKKRSQNRNLPQSVLAAGQHDNFVKSSRPKSLHGSA